MILGEMYIPEPSTEPAVVSAEESPIGTPERKKVEEEEEEVRSPSQVHIKSKKEGWVLLFLGDLSACVSFFDIWNTDICGFFLFSYLDLIGSAVVGL